MLFRFFRLAGMGIGLRSSSKLLGFGVRLEAFALQGSLGFSELWSFNNIPTRHLQHLAHQITNPKRADLSCLAQPTTARASRDDYSPDVARKSLDNRRPKLGPCALKKRSPKLELRGLTPLLLIEYRGLIIRIGFGGAHCTIIIMKSPQNNVGNY